MNVTILRATGSVDARQQPAGPPVVGPTLAGRRHRKVASFRRQAGIARRHCLQASVTAPSQLPRCLEWVPSQETVRR